MRPWLPLTAALTAALGCASPACAEPLGQEVDAPRDPLRPVRVREPVLDAPGREAFLVTGLVTFNVSYALSTLAGALLVGHGSRGWAPLFVPVAGPFIACGTGLRGMCLNQDKGAALETTVLIFDGLMQGLGVGFALTAVVDARLSRSRRGAGPSADVVLGPGGTGVRVAF